jgi:RHS repeat-associated protein
VPYCFLAQQKPFGTLSYTYDAAGNVLTISSSNTGGISDMYMYDALNRLSTVTDASGQTTYGYDDVGNLQGYTYPNGVASSYNYDQLNRLKQVSSQAQSSQLASYTYTLGAAGNRLTVAELSGRNVVYGYDSLYRLTSETVASDPHSKNGASSYTYDNVGNRLTLNTTLPPAGGMTYSYDVDDRLSSEQYDAEGNTTFSSGNFNNYDFENRLQNHAGAVSIFYDGDGNRFSETVGNLTTNYLVDTQNPTGYAQVVDELQSGTVTRTYSYGLERISETQPINSTLTTSFYGYDGHGSVRFLTNSAGAVTDTYDYDAFGNLLSSTGNTPNTRLFAGEEYDAALGTYYNRARYYSPNNGRFLSMDTFEGDPGSPESLHKYLYAGGNPVDRRDPSGNDFDLGSTLAASAGGTTIFGLSVIQSAIVIQAVSGALVTASLTGFGAALEGKSPEQIEAATGNPYNIVLGALFAIGGSVAIASKLGAYTLALVSLGGGGSKAYNEYKQGHQAAAIYYGVIGTLGAVLAAAVPYLRGTTQTAPTVTLKGPIPSAEPANLAEQLVLQEAEANAEDVIIPAGQLGDAPRLEANYGSGTWAKAQWVHRSPDGTNYTVHYFINLVTGERVEFKFTNTP